MESTKELNSERLIIKKAPFMVKSFLGDGNVRGVVRGSLAAALKESCQQNWRMIWQEGIQYAEVKIPTVQMHTVKLTV